LSTLTAPLPLNEIEKARQSFIARAKIDFYTFCVAKHPTFYRPEKKHLYVVCRALDDFHRGRLRSPEGAEYRGVVINMPPRHGKSLTLELFCQWVLGDAPRTAIAAASYNEELSTDFARHVRDGIQEDFRAENRITTNEVFPDLRIKRGDSSVSKWALEDAPFSFLATSPRGTFTGKGVHYLLIDDLVKSAVEAHNERILEELWSWYTDTALSRLEEPARQIVLMTRWNKRDLTGRLLEKEREKWHVLSFPAEDDDGMLDASVLSKERFMDIRSKTSNFIVQANYQQSPIDLEGLLYGPFDVFYPDSPPKFIAVHAFTDTADKGSDYFSGGIYGVFERRAYLLDVLYTDRPMSYTEPEWARRLAFWRVRKNHIESNNGGEGFARAVKNELLRLDYHDCLLATFAQTANKEARIRSQATQVNNQIVMPHDWAQRWPEFHRAVTELPATGRWIHDDAPDMLTGIVEKSLRKTWAFA